jgi:hypothetical protein
MVNVISPQNGVLENHIVRMNHFMLNSKMAVINQKFFMMFPWKWTMEESHSWTQPFLIEFKDSNHQPEVVFCMHFCVGNMFSIQNILPQLAAAWLQYFSVELPWWFSYLKRVLSKSVGRISSQTLSAVDQYVWVWSLWIHWVFLMGRGHKFGGVNLKDWCTMLQLIVSTFGN